VAGDYLRANARYHATSNRQQWQPHVASHEQATAYDELANAPGGVTRKTLRHAHGLGESYPYCALHPRQRIDAEPCLRCRIDVLELKLAGAERLLGGLQMTLADVAPIVLSLNDALTTLREMRAARVVVDDDVGGGE